jgi:hypothetical protein
MQQRGHTRAAVVVAVAGIVLAFAVTAAAAERSVATTSVFASGLEAPRGLTFDALGNLYVAEGGTGGSQTTTAQQCMQVPNAGPYSAGFTSRISRFDRFGHRSIVADGLPSSATNPQIGGFVSGVADVKFLAGQLYAIEAGAGCSHGLLGTHNSLLRVNMFTGATTDVANLSAFQQANPVLDPNPADYEPDGTWYSMASFAGALYAVEPNHGEVDRISPQPGRISRLVDVSAVYGHIVPTSLSEHAGRLYFGNLGTFPIVPGSAAIYRLTLGGRLSVVATGLSTVLGTAWDRCGRLYALESMTNPGFPIPQMNGNSGMVVRIGRDGSQTPVVTGLDFPSAMAFGPDGRLYISNDGFGPPTGTIVRADVGGGCGD